MPTRIWSASRASARPARSSKATCSRVSARTTAACGCRAGPMSRSRAIRSSHWLAKATSARSWSATGRCRRAYRRRRRRSTSRSAATRSSPMAQRASTRARPSCSSTTMMRAALPRSPRRWSAAASWPMPIRSTAALAGTSRSMTAPAPAATMPAPPVAAMAVQVMRSARVSTTPVVPMAARSARSVPSSGMCRPLATASAASTCRAWAWPSSMRCGPRPTTSTMPAIRPWATCCTAIRQSRAAPSPSRRLRSPMTATPIRSAPRLRRTPMRPAS